MEQKFRIKFENVEKRGCIDLIPKNIKEQRYRFVWPYIGISLNTGECESMKHAYLIIAHKSDLVFYSLLQMLDDVRNDIYVHMDLKNIVYNPCETANVVCKAGLYHTKRTKVAWGGYSLINAEFILLEESLKRNYAYYHLLSGADLPIQTQDTIHHFFEQHQGKEFVGFYGSELEDKDRVDLWHVFQEHIGKNRGIVGKCNTLFLKIQKLLRVSKGLTKRIHFYKGVQWFSITDDLARYVVENREWAEQTFKYTRWCDEVFLQTIVGNSKWDSRVYKRFAMDDSTAAVRYIDWKRGNPYVFRQSDYDMLGCSNMMFARKFDAEIDGGIVLKIREFINMKSEM